MPTKILQAHISWQRCISKGGERVSNTLWTELQWPHFPHKQSWLIFRHTPILWYLKKDRASPPRLEMYVYNYCIYFPTLSSLRRCNSWKWTEGGHPDFQNGYILITANLGSLKILGCYQFDLITYPKHQKCKIVSKYLQLKEGLIPMRGGAGRIINLGERPSGLIRHLNRTNLFILWPKKSRVLEKQPAKIKLYYLSRLKG